MVRCSAGGTLGGNDERRASAGEAWEALGKTSSRELDEQANRGEDRGSSPLLVGTWG